jgi:hypothetical protein
MSLVLVFFAKEVRRCLEKKMEAVAENSVPHFRVSPIFRMIFASFRCLFFGSCSNFRELLWRFVIL